VEPLEPDILAPKRRRLLVLWGPQIRYGALVCGALLVLLIFTGFHAYYLVQSLLPESQFAALAGEVKTSTIRLFAVGFLYIVVIGLPVGKGDQASFGKRGLDKAD